MPPLGQSRLGNPREYRPAAGVVLFNAKGQVWLGRRAGTQTQHVWQFPQGGIDPGETSEHAAIRELHEETGIAVQNIAPLAAIEPELFYDFPTDYIGSTGVGGRMKKWRGQRQSWFAFRFIGTDADVDLNHQSPAEFSDWRWGELAEAPALVIPFKRKVYERLLVEFGRFATS